MLYFLPGEFLKLRETIHKFIFGFDIVSFVEFVINFLSSGENAGEFVGGCHRLQFARQREVCFRGDKRTAKQEAVSDYDVRKTARAGRSPAVSASHSAVAPSIRPGRPIDAVVCRAPSHHLPNVVNHTQPRLRH